jgi:hypothetical protein
MHKSIWAKKDFLLVLAAARPGASTHLHGDDFDVRSGASGPRPFTICSESGCRRGMPRSSILRQLQECPMADENDLARPITNREFGELKDEIYQTAVAAAVIGACVADHLSKSDRSHPKALVERATQIASAFEMRGQAYAATAMRIFARAAANPEALSSPSLSNDSSHGVAT